MPSEARIRGGAGDPDPAHPSRPAGSGLAHAWGALDRDRRLAAIAAIALFVTMFLPWYQQNAVVTAAKNQPLVSRNLNAFGVFSFVEAAVLLVAVAVLVLLYMRADGRRFQLPGGDGAVVLAAGLWSALLLILRLFDKPGITQHGVAANVGIQWGIFFALAAAGLLAYAGSRMRAGQRPEPPLLRRDAAALVQSRSAAPSIHRRARPTRAGADGRRAPQNTGPGEAARALPSCPRGGAALLRGSHRPTIAMTMPPASPPAPTSAAEVAEGLTAVGYLPAESTALVAYLATRLGKPVLVEGPAGVGKTELAKALAHYLGRELVRLQCYEGLDEAKALYEWNYRKQLLRIQAQGGDAGWSEVQEDIFGEEFLLARPLMTAIASEEPVVLLIDEIDKTDQEFEAMLLEVLSDFQISIPELGRVESRTHPVVLLTSNNSRELTEALKRRCLYLWLDYPCLEHELAIVRLHTPELSETVARRLVEVVGMVRELDLKKPPSIAESIDWARALLLLGAQDIDSATFMETMSVIVKHRTDMDVVAERVGLKLGATADAA